MIQDQSDRWYMYNKETNKCALVTDSSAPLIQPLGPSDLGFGQCKMKTVDCRLWVGV